MNMGIGIVIGIRTVNVIIGICWVIFSLSMSPMKVLAATDLPLQLIQLPAGFHIDIYADNVPNARQMTLSPQGILYVGTRKSGKVYAVLPNATKTKAEKVLVIADRLNTPNGVAYHNGHLYVAEINRIIRYDNIDEHYEKLSKPIVINESFPKESEHGWKFIRVGPDGYLYIPVGAPCNICLQEDPRYATIMKMKIDGSDLRIYAHGVRNSVGFDWHPVDKSLWFTDNGRDWLGDNSPPDELNRAPKVGMHFGFPFVHGKNIADPDYGQRIDIHLFTPPAMELGPHVAALGMSFYTGKQFPKTYQNHIFIPEHGSWNRTQKSGYRIMMVKVNGASAVSYEPFATGWLQGQTVWGRPVATLIMPDGSMLVSDDYAGVIYRIFYS